MKNYIECRPVMLPTEEVDTTLYMSMGHRICHWAEAGNIDYFCHLYLVSEEEIKEGGVYLAYFPNKAPEIHIRKDGLIPTDAGRKKVVATTDKFLSLPLIPSSFIEKWINEQGKIKEVRIEWDARNSCPVLENCKAYNSGTAIILPTEDKIYSREEMKGFYREYIKHLMDMPLPEGLPFDEWFDKNYPI